MNNPLVSVLVVTYNSGDYILDTLESIKSQTYANIELIISDDGSSDQTITLANDWISKNKSRFQRTQVITVKNNTGVSANYNRGVAACTGSWIKNVDGDDLITPHCIASNLSYIFSHPEVEVLFSDLIAFKGTEDNILYKYSDSEFNGFFELTAHEQFKRLIVKNVLPSTTFFIKASVLKKYPYNENYKGLEDYPMWVTLTHNGHKVYYMNEITAKYRRVDSITLNSQRLYSTFYMDSKEQYYWGELYHYLRENNCEEGMIYHMKHFMLYHIAVVVFKNRGTFLNKALFAIFRRILKCG